MVKEKNKISFFFFELNGMLRRSNFVFVEVAVSLANAYHR